MRFLSAPWLGLLKNDCWRQNAANANAMALRLATGCQRLGLQLLFPCQANSVFITLGKPQQEALRQKGRRFYTFIGAGGCRFMCSWDTTTEDVDTLLADLATL
jgi:threonine aldolase